MEPVYQRQSSGAALVFILMALIALLALSVVFLSRIGRETPLQESGPAQTNAEAPAAAVIDSGNATVPATDIQSTAPGALHETPAADPIVAPPPPPPVTTPDTRNLPPEG